MNPLKNVHMSCLRDFYNGALLVPAQRNVVSFSFLLARMSLDFSHNDLLPVCTWPISYYAVLYRFF